MYTASLNDIMFFLLLFFLIISTMATPMALKVMLPKSATPEQIAAKRTINMSVTHDKRYFVEDKEVAFNDIEAALSGLVGELKGEERPNVLLQADNTVDVQTVVRLLDIGNRMNIKITMIVEKD